MMEAEELRDEVKRMSESIDSKYEKKLEKLGRVEEVSLNSDIAKLEKEYAELREKVSEERKKGRDTFIANSILMDFPPKIRMAKATNDALDILKAESVLKDAAKEINKSIREKEVDVRGEVEDRFQNLLKLEPEITKKYEYKLGSSKEETDKVVDDISSMEEVKLIAKKKKEFFHVKDGRELEGLEDLSNYLRVMSKKTFDYHANKDFNHFAKWIRDILGSERIADMIENIKDKNEMADLLDKILR